MGFLDFLGGVGSLFSAIGQFIGQIFFLLWSLMQQLFLFLWNNLVAVANFLVNGFKKLAQFFESIWTHYIRPAILRLATLYEKLRARIQAVLNPVIKVIQRIRAWYDAHILPWQFAIINLIQRVRMFLTVLRLFHVKWAEALDAQLAAIQSKVTESIRLIRGTLNEIISTIGLVFQADLLIRRNVLGATLLTHLGAVKRILGYGGNRILSGDEEKLLNRNASRYKTATVQSHVAQLAASGLTDDDLKDREAARKALAAATG